jgi:hypothetical protein
MDSLTPPPETSESQFLEILSIMSLDDQSNSLYGLSKLFGLDGLQSLIDAFGGRRIKIPTRESFRESLVVATCYYYREIKGLEWGVIVRLVPFTFNTQKMSMKIMKLSNRLKSLIGDLAKKET